MKIIQDLQKSDAPDFGQAQQCGWVKHFFLDVNHSLIPLANV